MRPNVTASQVAFHNTHFTVSNSSFDYAAVDSIRFVYTVTRWMLYGLVHSGTSHSAKLDLYIRNQKTPINIRYPREWIRSFLTSVTHKKADADDLVACYRELSQRTFKTRAERYLEQVRSTGAFIYDQKRFTKDGAVLSASGKPLFKFADVSSYRYVFHLACAPKGSLAEKALKSGRPIFKLLGGYTDINTEFDQDVFYFLLNHLYRISWPTRDLKEKRQ